MQPTEQKFVAIVDSFGNLYIRRTFVVVGHEIF